MKRAELERYRTALVTKREGLLDRFRTARGSEDDDTGSDSPELGDRALSSITRDLVLQLSSSERELLKRIDAALERLESGAFGVCVNCSKPVQKGRLQAVPWARHCIECQELQDRGEI